MINVRIKKVDSRASMPTYGSEVAGCFDFYALGPVTVPALQSLQVRTGLALEVPDDYVMLLYSRSGHGFKGDVRLANCVGVIDADYRGELMVKFRNDGARDFSIGTGKAIAQGMLVRRELVCFEEVDELSDTDRGVSGFGSTDEKASAIMGSVHLK